MFANGISTVKIAEIEGCCQNAVWKSVERAREKIKKFLEKNKKQVVETVQKRYKVKGRSFYCKNMPCVL